MASLSELLHTAGDDIEVPVLPTGTWLAVAVAGSVTEPKLDKNGAEYSQAKLVLKPKAPAFDGAVDEDELATFIEADGLEETTIFHSQYMARKADVKAMINRLKAAGAATTGRDLSEIMSNGIAGVEFHVEITHGTYEGELQVRCDKIFAAE